MIKDNKRKIMTTPLALILLCSFIIGFFQIQKQAGGLYELLGENFSYPAAAAVNISRAVKGRDESEPPAGEEKEEQEAKNPMFFLSSMSTSNTMAQLMLLIAVVSLAGICTALVKNKERNNALISRMKYYLQWCLKFLSPVQQSIVNRSDVYDINPITEVIGEKSPRFVFEQNAGFFYGVSR